MASPLDKTIMAIINADEAHQQNTHFVKTLLIFAHDEYQNTKVVVEGTYHII